MAIPADRLERERYYSFEDWLDMDESVRAELIDGRLYMMAPPSRWHQYAAGAIYRQLGNFLEGKRCEVYFSPFGVRLFANKDTVFEPDIIMVCDPSKLNDRGCDGAPDLIVEILSPSTAGHDKFKKFYQYLQAGVREYWLVDPEYKTVTVHTLSEENGSRYVTDEYFYPDVTAVPVGVLPGCGIELKKVFQPPVSGTQTGERPSDTNLD